MHIHPFVVQQFTFLYEFCSLFFRLLENNYLNLRIKQNK